MVKTIGNPLSWSAGAVGATGGALRTAGARLGGDLALDPPRVREMTTDDIRYALRAGWDDFMAMRSDVMAIVVLYPIIGIIVTLFAFNANFAPYIFPMASGFALIGPVAAVGLYEVSRRREAGLPAGWTDALTMLRSPALAPILILGVYLLAIFFVWMMAANFLYAMTLGTEPYIATSAFFSDVLTTANGWWLIFTGVAVGFAFAALVLIVSVVSFPLLLDRDAGVPLAVATSVRVAEKNPRVVAIWGLLLATLLLIGSLPMFLGLIVVFPVLGHASWHFYRRAVD